MRSDRSPTARSGRFPQCVARCARTLLVMLLAGTVLYALAPMAAAKSTGKENAGHAAGHPGDGAPGQKKKAGPKAFTVQATPVEDRAGRAAVAATNTKHSVKATRAPTQQLKAKPAKRSASKPGPTTPQAVVTPSAVIVPPAPILTTAPAASAPPTVSRDAPRTPARPAAKPRRRVPTGTSATLRSSPPLATAGGPAVAVRTAAATPGPTRRLRPDARKDAHRGQDATAAGVPLTRTVVRVLEVVPVQLRAALAALAGLGLLLAGAAAVQTVRRRRLERQRRLLLADVGVLQSALLPQLPEQIGGARVSAAYRPAEGLAAGGDFYDAFELPGGRTGVLVGDVAGHGRDVVPLTALVRYNVRAYLEAGLAPRAAVHVAANVLVAHLGDLQVTIVVAIFDPGTGRLTYACAGHAPPLLLGSTTAPVTTCSSPPIGAGAATGRRQTTIAFAPGAVACFHTDGLDEVPVRDGRLGRGGVADELEALGPRRDAGDLLARVVRASRHQPDDMAACILTALPGGADRWWLRLEELEVDAVTLSSGGARRFLLACGVEGPRVGNALRKADAIVARDGTAVIEVRVGEALADARVTPPPAATLPIARRTADPAASAAAA